MDPAVALSYQGSVECPYFVCWEADRDWITDAMVRMGDVFEKAGCSS